MSRRQYHREVYSGFKEDTQSYVESLLHDIEMNLDTCIQKPAPLRTLTRNPILLLIKLSPIR